ncbi:MAG: glycosyltransferase family 2 protein [Campylobacterales bacterium]|nr:glycosyltransferase family 2 protein [Campylobacterales bacterium]
MKSNISVVIIAKDAQATIGETLKSLKAFDEVIVYINDSSDDTMPIAKSFKNVKVIEGEFKGFGDTKNHAASFASNDWILSLDSDEVILADLLGEIQTLILDNPQKLYIIKRDNYFLDKPIKHNGWGKDYLARLYHRKLHHFNSNRVHESIEATSDTIKVTLQHSFKHNAVTNINQFLQKVMRYSDLAAHNKKTCSFIVVIAKAHFAFFKSYILQLGFLDGWRGFVIAVSNFNGKFFRYTKRYINCKK